MKRSSWWYAQGGDILDALTGGADDSDVTVLHIWHDLIEPDGRSERLRTVRESFDLVARDGTS